MKSGYRILISIYITFMVYTVTSMVLGPAGTIQTAKLITYKDKLVQNTIKLSEISSQLILQSNRLRTDHDLIALKARELGFFKEGEGEIIIKGYDKNNISFSVGSYYKLFNPKIINVSNIRIFSSIVGLMAFLLMTIFKKNPILPGRRFPLNG